MSPSPAPDRRSPSPLIVERYAIHEAFAAGGMATVHFARLIGAQGFRRSVAAKRLLPHLAQDQEFARMLLEEARLAARVRHPNVVTTLDVVQTDSELLLVMEYVHGESLATLSREVSARGETIPLPIAVAMMIDALHGLHAVHEARDESGRPLGIVHRDVSPQNMLACTDGVTRIADFGIAKAFGKRQSTQRGVLKGKLAYMAPEQANQSSLSRMTDVYAAAIVLWELLTGTRLFDGKTHSEVLFKLLVEPVPPPSTRNRALPPELEEVVMRGLARVPEQRFATAQEMAAALERHAPPVRPHEIAAWVERVGGEPLRKRAAVLAAMEAGCEANASQASGVRTRGNLESVDPETLTVLNVDPQRMARAAQGETPKPRRRGPTRWQAAGCIAAVVLLGWGATLLDWPVAAHESRLDGPPPVPRATTEIERAPIPSTPAPLTAPVVEPAAPAAVVIERASDSVDAPRVDAPAALERTPAARDEAPARRPAPSSRSRRSTRSAHRDPSSRCDPPYTIDAAGRVLFKVECI